MRRKDVLVITLALAVGSMTTGCRFKGIESFKSATTPVEYKDGIGDPYASGGIASATGGTNTVTQYGKGALAQGRGKLDPSFDQPAKGTGQHAGEAPVQSRQGFGNSNAPANQTVPQDVQNPSARSGKM